ncbi:MAG: lipocalin family protein [Clostridia bacterium]|nr:lipocalin family protein [Clostridia bacterium]
MKKTLCIILAVMLLAVSLCACAGSNSIVGSWSGTSQGVAVTMSFAKDGTGVMSVLGGLASEEFTYTIEGSTLTVNATDGDTEVYDYAIDGDSLSLTYEGEVITLTKDK